MNERIKQLAEQAGIELPNNVVDGVNGPGVVSEKDKLAKFAELIVRECIDIAKNWEDQLEKANLLKESNAVGIVAYRIARQFGVEE